MNHLAHRWDINVCSGACVKESCTHENYDTVAVLRNGKLHLIITTQSLDKAEQLHTSKRKKLSLFIC